jgi:microcystin-dependent protein
MAAPFVAEIRPWACNFAPNGWAMCQAQLLPISQFTALFSLIGTYYGGNGTSNFGLPDLRGRVPLMYGTDQVGNNYSIGEIGGEENITLLSGQMPIHNHTFSGSASNQTRSGPATGAALGTSSGGAFFYGPSNGAPTQLNVGTISLYSGGNQAHTNQQPYQVINWCIALQGIYPSRN